MWLFANSTKHRQIIYQIESRKETSKYVLVSSLSNDQRERNCYLKSRVPRVSVYRQQGDGSTCPWSEEPRRATNAPRGGKMSLETAAEFHVAAASHAHRNSTTMASGQPTIGAPVFRDLLVPFCQLVSVLGWLAVTNGNGCFPAQKERRDARKGKKKIERELWSAMWHCPTRQFK